MNNETLQARLDEAVGLLRDASSTLCNVDAGMDERLLEAGRVERFLADAAAAQLFQELPKFKQDFPLTKYSASALASCSCGACPGGCVAQVAPGRPIADCLRGRFETWAMETKHPVFGFIGDHWLDHGDDPNTYANDYIQGAWVVWQELQAQLAALKAQQVGQAPVEVMRFQLKHPETGETRTVNLTRADVADGMEDTIFERLGALICDCEPVGETNVVDCNCDEYIYEFELSNTPPQPAPAQDVERWTAACGDWRDTTLAIHGERTGHIASGIPESAAHAIVKAHNSGLPEQAAAHDKQSGGDV